MTRDESQEYLIKQWFKSKGKGSLVAATGYGKTRLGMLAISKLLAKYPDKKVIIVVPSDAIRKQWIDETIKWGVFDNCEVKTMNDVSKNKYECFLLVIDEIHKTLSNINVNLYNNIKYKAILGLTATFERLDGRHIFLDDICPVIAEVSLEEAIKNNWLSPYKEYLVLIHPEDIDTYNTINSQFNNYFSFFNYDFQLAMSCVTSWQTRANLAKQRCQGNDFKDINKQVLANAMGFSRTLQARKQYINNHPKKIELTNLILEHRIDKKCITFSNTIAMAEKIKYGKVYSGKDTIKSGRIKLQDFIDMEGGVLNTIAKVKEGLNIPDLSVAVNLGINSSYASATQKRGRVIRTNGTEKIAEIFYLVIDNTVELKWFQNSIGNSDYITIDESELINVLENKPYTSKKNKETTVISRY